MFKLRQYQINTIEVLKSYLSGARFSNPKSAYDTIQKANYGQGQYKPFNSLEGLQDAPYVCLRLPTGGGKTLLSAHTIKLASEHYLESDYPLTLWLVPTDKIKQQTLETLTDEDHPNRKVLNEAFGGKFRVFDIADFRQIRPADIDSGACIIISTFQSLRVDDTNGRKVYAHDENLEPHFSKISAIESMEFLEDSNQLKYSLVNLLHWYRPLVIIDEAHNAKSELSIEVLRRVNAACVIEYTATPAKNSNVIHLVTAAELKAEEMIKLPLVVQPAKTWQVAVEQSIQTRQKLEELANNSKLEDQYIRPIVLFQAEKKDRDITVEVLKRHLIESEKIKEEEIAIATGTQKELDGLDLFNRNCKIRYIITVEALKEGWDCSFAYVLCSIANTTSATAIEQLIGRVLRMPYAQRRKQEVLNKAYAHTASTSWLNTVDKLKDCLVKMGFEKQEAEQVIYQQSLDGFNDNVEDVIQFSLSGDFDSFSLDLVEQSNITLTKNDKGVTQVTYKGALAKDTIENLVNAIKDPEEKKKVARKLDVKMQHKEERLSPSQRGERFILPQICLCLDDDWDVAEPESYLHLQGDWRIADYYKPLTKDDFSLDEDGKQYIIDIANQKMQVGFLGKKEQLSLYGIKTNITVNDLCSWFDHNLRSHDITSQHLLEYIRKTIEALLERGDLDIAALVRGKYILQKVLKDRINQARKEAQKKGFQLCLLDNDIMQVDLSQYAFEFPINYPINQYYEGSYQFKNHYYPQIAAMNKEEFECAKVLDMHDSIEYWLRNIENQPDKSFWLPTDSSRFYPDFIAKLKDDRLLIVEYKGQHLLTNEDSKQKELIGHRWAELSHNLFLMATNKDDKGRGVFEQIDCLLKNESFIVP
ncbi:DEAD/DEAH box helicase [Fastidiosibacter lacustris]|uniref:DEAD/DEAH box helicase n=1 Tax=Fastidiosibacter lacustris TaxID=2056695 RepID=UPI000E34AD27|nr:DEAD/DEAH box helicase family protein [Fastidiosibacter lacustris]